MKTQTFNLGNGRIVEIRTAEWADVREAGVAALSAPSAYENEGITLRVASARPTEVVASQDGAAYCQSWHQGAETGEAVYVERWTPAGRVFHGYVDPTTRQIVQAG